MRAKGNKSALGHKHTEESKRKISLAKKGKVSLKKGCKISDEVKLKISLKNKGRKLFMVKLIQKKQKENYQSCIKVRLLGIKEYLILKRQKER